VIGVGSPVGARRGRGAIAGRPPTPGPHRSIDIAGGGMPETSQNGRGGLQTSATGEAQWLIGPRTMDRGITVPPVGRHWTIGRCRGRMGAQNGRQWLGLLRRGTSVKMQTWSGTRSPPTGPRRWVRETPGPPLDVARRSADVSVVFLVPYRGRLKRLHLHCRAGRNWGYQHPAAEVIN